MTTNKTHGSDAPPSTESHPEPTLAERARTLVHIGQVGSLSTHSRKATGYPFGSIMPYAPDADGRVTFLISSMAMHTQNVLQDPRASLLVTPPKVEGDPLGASRVTLVGDCLAVTEAENEGVRSLYLSRHANARHWVDYGDFSFFRLDPQAVYMVGGFGVMGWVSATDYRAALPDPLADSAESILRHMNEDHADALVLLVSRRGLEAVEASMTSIDRLGFNAKAKTKEGYKGLRIPFPTPVSNAEETRRTLVAMVREARGEA